MSDAPQKDERQLLEGFLDMYRATAVRKVLGLSDEDARRVMTPSGLSPLGVLNHLGWVEYQWFRVTFAGEDVAPAPREHDNNAVQFEVNDNDTVSQVVTFYENECAHAREVAASAELVTSSVNESRYWGPVDLRWILVHMIEETARHVGHLDLMRESIDGATGYL